MTDSSIKPHLNRIMANAIGLLLYNIDSLPMVDEMFTGISDNVTYMVTVLDQNDSPLFVLDYDAPDQWSIAYADLTLNRSDFITEVQGLVEAYVASRIKWYVDHVY